MAIKVTGSNLARTIFGQSGTDRMITKTQPLLGFQFFVKIKYDPIATPIVRFLIKDPSSSQLSSLVKSVTLPGMSTNIKTINSYNRNRVCNGKISFDPVSITMHDVVGGISHALWQIYYNWYYNDGLSSLSLKTSWLSSPPWEDLDIASLIESPFESAFGAYTSEGMNQTLLKKFGYSTPMIRYLFKEIEIFQVHGGKYNKVTLFNPLISKFSHSGMSYDSSEPVDMTFEFNYEWAEYEIKNKRIDGTMRRFFEQSRVVDFVEFTGPRLDEMTVSDNTGNDNAVVNLQSANAAPNTSVPTASVSSVGNQVDIVSRNVGTVADTISEPQRFLASKLTPSSFVDFLR